MSRLFICSWLTTCFQDLQSLILSFKLAFFGYQLYIHTCTIILKPNITVTQICLSKGVRVFVFRFLSLEMMLSCRLLVFCCCMFSMTCVIVCMHQYLVFQGNRKCGYCSQKCSVTQQWCGASRRAVLRISVACLLSLCTVNEGA